jgi:hypothetical protein
VTIEVVAALIRDERNRVYVRLGMRHTDDIDPFVLYRAFRRAR